MIGGETGFVCPDGNTWRFEIEIKGTSQNDRTYLLEAVTSDISINWGDGTIENYTGNAWMEHEYAEVGTYLVTISGTAINFAFNAYDAIWPRTQQPEINIIDPIPAGFGLTSAFFMFYTATVANNGQHTEEKWFDCAVPNVTNMHQMFVASNFNQPIINSWDVSNVTNMSYLFNYNEKFNQDISNWNVRNVENADSMFDGASAFNQDLSNWCFAKIASKPNWFDDGATSWTLPKPRFADDPTCNP